MAVDPNLIQRSLIWFSFKSTSIDETRKYDAIAMGKIKKIINAGDGLKLLSLEYENGNTLLHKLVEARYENAATALIAFLIKSGANAHLTNAAGQTPRQLAASSGQLAITNLLTTGGADVPLPKKVFLPPEREIVNSILSEQNISITEIKKRLFVLDSELLKLVIQEAGILGKSVMPNDKAMQREYYEKNILLDYPAEVIYGSKDHTEKISQEYIFIFQEKKKICLYMLFTTIVPQKQ